MTTEQQSTSDSARQNVATYRPAKFQPAEFQVVTNSNTSPEGGFQFAQFSNVSQGSVAFDPMFDVYDVKGQERVAGIQDDNGEVSLEQSLELRGLASGHFDAESLNDESLSHELSHLEGMPKKSEDRSAVGATAGQAEALRQALENEHVRQLEEACSAAKEEGRAEAQREHEEKVKSLEQRYASLVEDMNVQILEGIEAVERRAVDFALAISKKLVGTIVEVNPEYVLQVIREAIKLTGGATIKAIRVSPQDLEFLKMLTPGREFKEFDGSWSFQVDDGIRAGCIVETSAGEIEFDLDKAWERIKESVIKVR